MHMDPVTHDDLPESNDAGGDDKSSLADEPTVPHLCPASRTMGINMDAGTGTDIDTDAGAGTGTGIRAGNNNLILDTNDATTSLPHEHQKREHNSQDGAARSLYTRLLSMFQLKDKDRGIIFPTPPASPDIRHRTVYALASPSLSQPLDQHPHTCGPACAVVDSENSNPLALWTPLTPDSSDHQRSRRCRSNTWTKLDYLSQKLFISSVDSEDIQLALPHVSGREDLQLHCRGIGDVSDTGLGLGASLYLSSRVGSAGPHATADPRQQKEIVHGRGNHIKEGIQLGEDDGSAHRSGSVKWGKTRAPPIPWDVLIDDLCSPVSLTWDRDSESYGSAQYTYTTVAECEDDFYDLQYALEISRRDHRKTMGSNPNTAGEYSKSRESWAILHADRAMPADQEYWFRYWLQWHRRLEERQVIRAQKAKRKEEMKRYQMVDPWPLSDQRTARHPRQADEEQHPNLRLVRHRTRSAPGRVHV